MDISGLTKQSKVALLRPMRRGNKSFDFDVAVIGAGSAGFAASRAAGMSGQRTVLIEGAKEIGGLCILRGCMPTKALLYAADVLHLIRHAHIWGLHARATGFDLARVMKRKASMVENFASYRRMQLAQGPFTFKRAQAEFLDEHTLGLTNGEKLRARSFVLCTGSTVAPPPLHQLGQVGYLTSDTALGLKRLPKSLIVLGGGPVAVELAQFFVRFDVQVTLVQRSPHVLHSFDVDAATVIEGVFRREGMTVFTGTQLKDAWQEGGLKCIGFLHQGQRVRVAAEEILFGLGRVANTEGLGLDKLGVFTENGRVITNTEMQTTAPHVYAAGDCTGTHEIVHVAIQQAEVAAYNLTHPRRKKSMDYRLLSTVVFTDPQIAQVGLTEKEAAGRKIPYLVASYPFNDHGKSLIMEALDGFVKLLCHPHTGEILGGSVVGPIGGELIHEIVAAMHKRMTVQELAVMPHYHPTLAEIWTYPAEELAAKVAGN